MSRGDLLITCLPKPMNHNDASDRHFEASWFVFRTRFGPSHPLHFGDMKTHVGCITRLQEGIDVRAAVFLTVRSLGK